jgi:hypothetical protein
VVLMLGSMTGGLDLLLIVVGGIFLGRGELIGGSFRDGRGRAAVTAGVVIAIGICVLAAAGFRTGV